MTPQTSLDHRPGWENIDITRLFPSNKRESSTSSSSCTLLDEDSYAHTQNAFPGASADLDRESHRLSNGQDECEELVEMENQYAPSEGHRYQRSNFRWWIPAYGIHENIIREEVQPFLGPEAEVRCGPNEKNEPGYYISAYRTFTPAMIRDLKSDSLEYEQILAARNSCPADSAENGVHAHSTTSTDGEMDLASETGHDEEIEERSNETTTDTCGHFTKMEA